MPKCEICNKEKEPESFLALRWVCKNGHVKESNLSSCDECGEKLERHEQYHVTKYICKNFNAPEHQQRKKKLD